MLTSVFLFCAVIGGIVMISQFALTLMGMGDDGGAFDGDLGGDVDVGGGDLDVDVDVETSSHASHLFEVLSLQTLVTGITVFGLVGYIADTSEQTPLVSIALASVAGLAGIYGMFFLMRGLHRLQDDGTVRIAQAAGTRGNVLVPIPAKSGGTGKVSLVLQGRLEEITALSDYDERLPTGTHIEVVEVIGPRTVLVAPVVEGQGSPSSDSLAESTSVGEQTS
ncbi:MAG: hypothetical protein DWQ31_14255 [Planctomycetota bacterium]|nr:MAG: hypothetical protein DWQ31_14255 [Planctomycetota bacterium]REJ94531.1 MAG: hypothetical protein DWQ35_07960 [Planctomycetota bacterium]REK18607.1 MAG: hypothetical protein DWQ42_19510 [Planctomycetota bacterium]REK37503.1 MAG: hypothetical protein DWQ46_21990 [Planctomycetota bacterium]